MDNIRQWCFGLCCAAIFCSVILMLAPSKRSEKMLGLGAAMLVLIMLFSPLADKDFFQGEDIFGGLNTETGAYSYTYDGFNSGLEYMVMASLKKAGAEVLEVVVDADAQPATAYVTLAQTDAAAGLYIKTMIKDEYGLDTVIIKGQE